MARQVLLTSESKFASSENRPTDTIGKSRAELYRMCISHVAVRNAIVVQNIGRMQVGHIRRQIAANLAPLMDSSLITLEGTMNQGNSESASFGFVPFVIEFFSAQVQLLLVCVSDK